MIFFVFFLNWFASGGATVVHFNCSKVSNCSASLFRGQVHMLNIVCKQNESEGIYDLYSKLPGSWSTSSSRWARSLRQPVRHSIDSEKWPCRYTIKAKTARKSPQSLLHIYAYWIDNLPWPANGPRRTWTCCSRLSQPLARTSTKYQCELRTGRRKCHPESTPSLHIHSLFVLLQVPNSPDADQAGVWGGRHSSTTSECSTEPS